MRSRYLLAGAAAAAVMAFASVASAEDVTYGYDALGRLTSVTNVDGGTITYAYDAAGNRTQLTSTDGLNHANPDSVIAIKNTALDFDPRVNDVASGPYTLSITGFSTPPAHGTAATISTGVRYTPTTGYVGADSFTYTLSDGHAANVVGTVSVYVNALPVASNIALPVVKNAAKTFDPRTSVMDESDTLTVTSVGTPTHGTAAVVSGTSVIYTPATNYTGSDSFAYTVADSHGASTTATVNVTVSTGVNQAPVAVNDDIVATRGVAFPYDPRVNDSDPDGDSILINAVSTPAHGTVTITGGGTGISYKSLTPYYGPDSFTYTVTDGTLTSNLATVTIFVNNRPTAVADSITTTAGTAITFDPRINDSDADGDTFIIVARGQGPSHGTAVINAGGTAITYTPAAGYTGTDSFNYTIRDTHNGTGVAVVTVTIN